METYCCETCDKDTPEDEGISYEPEGIFECYECYDARNAVHLDAQQDVDPIAVKYPHLARMSAMQQADPVGFYAACKDAPDTLPY